MSHRFRPEDKDTSVKLKVHKSEMKIRMDQLTKSLSERGPLPPDEAPNEIDAQSKMKGVVSFNPSLQNRRNSTAGVGHTSPIYYLIDEHDPEEVIRAWLDENPRIYENYNRLGTALAIGGYGPKWKDAWKDVADEYFGDD